MVWLPPGWTVMKYLQYIMFQHLEGPAMVWLPPGWTVMTYLHYIKFCVPASRGSGYGMVTARVDGNDVFALYKILCSSISRVRLWYGYRQGGR